MLLNGKPIDQVMEEDLQLLITEGRVEDLRMDFKVDCYDYETGKAEDKAKKRKEFCKDVAALANASGGWIICGMAETAGRASQLLGVENLNIDARKRDFVAWMDNDIEPKLYGVVMKSLKLADDNIVMIIEVPRSFAGPHRTKTNEFPLRRDGKVDPNMSINDLRRAFVGNASYADQIRDFRRQRVESILNPEHPDSVIKLNRGPLFSVHILPLGMIEQPNRLSFTSTNAEFAQKALQEHENLGSLHGNRKFNLNGFLLPDNTPTRVSQYFQIYRNGVIEYVKSFLGMKDPHIVLPMRTLEPHILSGIAYSVRLLKSLDVNEPCYIYLTFARIKERTWAISDQHHGFMEDLSKIQHDPLFLPELYIDSWQERIESQMKPLLDIWANTIGLARSQSYDAEGSFTQIESHFPVHIPSTIL